MHRTRLAARSIDAPPRLGDDAQQLAGKGERKPRRMRGRVRADGEKNADLLIFDADEMNANLGEQWCVDFSRNVEEK